MGILQQSYYVKMDDTFLADECMSTTRKPS